jgi:glycosyltransferase involved in cell wall biosynthesis
MEVALYVPSFNAAGTIRPCLESALKESFPLKEIIVVDDASTDDTAEIASQYPVKLIRHKINRGLAAARNTAIKQITSEFVASIDADCLIHPEWLKRLMEEFKSPLVVGSGGRLLETRTSSVFDLWRSIHMKQSWEDTKAEPPFLFGSNTVFRRNALLEAGLYNEGLRNNYEDVDICQRLKNKGYTLRYQPQAYAEHLKKDNLYSLLNTFWRWNLEFYCQQSYYNNENDFGFKLNDNLGLAHRYLEDDIHSKRHELLYLDFLLGLHHCLKDFEYYILRDGQSQVSNLNLSCWLSLLDLVFFHRFDRQEDNLRTIIPENNKTLQNFLALNLVLGLPIRERFKDEEFQKLLYKHLLLSLYKINDPYLLDKIFNLALPHKVWSDLYEKKHPLLHQVFLRKLLFCFGEWMKQSMFNTQKLVQLIELSAKLTDKAGYS